MKTRRSQVHWGLVITTAVVVYLVTFILGLALSVPVLAFFTWSRLDPQRAILASSLVSAGFVVVVTGAGAWWVARRVAGTALLHGFLVGLVVALLSFILDLLFIRAIALVGLGLYGLMVAAGVLGGVVGRRR